MKSVLAATVGLIVPSITLAQHEGMPPMQGCEASNQNFTEAFTGLELFGGHHEEGEEEPARKHDEIPELDFISCNHTHFHASINGEEGVFPLSVYEYSECMMDMNMTSFFRQAEEAAGSCYYVICATEEELSGGGHHNATALFASKHGEPILATAHVPVCCEYANETVRHSPHHYCNVADFFDELKGDEEEYEPEEEDDEGQTCDEINKNFTNAFTGIEYFHHEDHHDDDEDDHDHGHGLRNLLHDESELPKWELLECNETHFVVATNDVADIYPIDIYGYEECEEEHDEYEAGRRVLHGGGNNCYYAICATEEELSGEDDHHGRVIARSRHGDKVLVTAHVEMCCHEANYTVRLHPHHFCSVADFFEALQEEGETTAPRNDDIIVPIAIAAVVVVGLALAGLAFYHPATPATNTEAKAVEATPVEELEAKQAAKPEEVAVAKAL